MTNRPYSLYSVLALTLCAHSALNSEAGVIPTKVFSTTNGSAVFGERVSLSYETFFPVSADYFVDVLDSSSIFAFAASHADLSDFDFQFASRPVGESSPASIFAPGFGLSSTTRVGWDATTISQAQWDAGHQVVGTMGGGVNFNTQAVGSFSSLFGDDAGVSIFWLNNASGFPIDESSDTEQADWDTVPAEFSYNAEPNTQFVALGAAGQIVGITIPEPSSCSYIALLGILTVVIRKYR